MVDGVLIVTVHGEIDHAVKDVLSQGLLSDDGATPPRIVADLSEVTFMDSSGINVFVTAHRRASGAQGWLRIAGAQDSVVRLLHLVGVDEIIPCHPTLQQALSNCPPVRANRGTLCSPALFRVCTSERSSTVHPLTWPGLTPTRSAPPGPRSGPGVRRYPAAAHQHLCVDHCPHQGEHSSYATVPVRVQSKDHLPRRPVSARTRGRRRTVMQVHLPTRGEG
ncbi:STAS domain-containing protein [Streptomyces sp. NPDC001817]|uniref:STAS domain-containing protein n=1 Tax=Streptomyces sp. NPDC001817 TaxID=3154398 RepID=UPI00332B6F85